MNFLKNIAGLIGAIVLVPIMGVLYLGFWAAICIVPMVLFLFVLKIGLAIVH